MLNRFICLALSVSCIAQVAARAQSPASANAAPAYSNEAFVVESSRTAYRFENDGTGSRESHVRVKVLGDAGVQQWGQLVFGFNAATERLDIRFVRVFKAGGTIVNAPPEAVQELTSPVEREAPVYTDFRQKHVTVPSLRPGETLEFDIVTTMVVPVAPGHFWLEHDFLKDAVILDEQLEVDIPGSRPIVLRTAAGAEPTISDARGRRVYSWTSRQLTPSDTKRSARPDDDETARAAVRLTTFQSWDDVGSWYAGIERSARVATGEIRAKAQELTSGRTTDLEKLEALYDFVSPNFRYVSISLGAGRYQPRSAADVLRDQYGDCKDKHTLLASLMESIGIPASTVLIQSEGTVDPDFPSPSQFDHAITRAQVGNEAVWLDVTTEVAPFRLLSSNLRGKKALVVSARGTSRLEDTPSDPPFQNLQIHQIEGTLGDLGTLSARVKVAFRGDLELALRMLFRRAPPARWREVVEDLNTSSGIGGEISDWKISNPAATKTPFEIEYQVTKVSFVDWTKKTADLHLPMSNFELPQQGAKKALMLGSPAEVQYRLQLELGAGYGARLPVPVSVSRDYGQYRAAYRLEGKVLTAERSLRTSARTVAAERSADYAAFRRVVAADDAQLLSLDLPKAAAGIGSGEIGVGDLLRSGTDALRNSNFVQAATLFKRLVAMEPTHQTAWSGLGLAFAGLRQTDESINAFKKQIDINPFDESAYVSLGTVYLSQRRYPEAEAAFLKQLEVSPLDQRAPALLGQQYLEMKRFADAIPQLERAVAVNPDDAFLQVSRGDAYLNAGRDAEALAAFGRAVEISPTPDSWNNVAYHLSEKGVYLERARQYAESAVTSITAESRNLSVDRVTRRELAVAGTLGSYWDTLGWVFFAKGDLARAEQLVSAAWRLAQRAVIGDHLGQIYEKQGRRDLAIRTYAMVLSLERPDPRTRERLQALAGPSTKVDALIETHAGDPVAMRTVAVKSTGTAGMAEFFVLLGRNGAEAVSFVSGDEPLRGMIAVVRAADYGDVLPDASPAKILRRASLSCPSASARRSNCELVLLRPSEAVAATVP